MSLEIKYIERFGSEQAQFLAQAAEYHGDMSIAQEAGNDYFIWVIFKVLDFDCVKKYAHFHKITVSFEDFKQFCCDNAEQIGKWTGDFGMLGLFTGSYSFMYDSMKEASKK